jgi:hypothetical protein
VVMQIAQRLFVAAVCALGLLIGTTAAQAQNTKLLPNDTEMIVALNLGQILQSDLIKKNELIVNLVKGKIEDGLDSQGVSKWFEKAGFDLFRDLSSVTIAVPGGKRDQSEAFFLLEGSFDAKKVETAATEAAKEAGETLKVIDISNKRVFEIKPKGDKTVYAAVLDKKTLVLTSSKDDMTEAISRLGTGKKAEFKADGFKNLAGTINGKQSIGIVATSDIMAKMAEKGGEKRPAKMAGDLAEKLIGAGVTITIGKDIDFHLAANAKNKSNADTIAALARAGLEDAKARAEKSAKNEEPFGAPAVEILKTVRITTDGSNLTIRGQITVDTLTDILKNLPFNNN